ncbi:MAG: type II toxin-antitoxin system VapC family toxin [Armatimonadota bacterium]|nr:type II toxin-antitoxin system VapC family toxin [Armatimonadota bacterium]
MPPVFVDANIPMYAAGSNHPLVEPARRVVDPVANGAIDAVTDAEVLQELLYRYWHIGRRTAGLQIFDAFTRLMAGRVLPVDEMDVRHARDLADRYSRLSPRDLIHLAIMLRHGIEEIASADAHFDSVPEVRRLDPRAFRRP